MNTVPPKDDGLACFILAIIMLVICWPTVIARFVIRIDRNALGLDDYLMGFGMLMTTAWSGVLISYCFTGGGYDPLDPLITDELHMTALKFYFICQSVYCPTTIPIKISICVSLLRISSINTVYRWSIWSIMAITVVAGIGSMAGIVGSCSPPSAFWDPSTGECNAFVNTFAAYFISACSILTDFALAILPAFMLWKVQLRRSVKVSVAILLGFAAVASCATIVRLRYLLALLHSQNFLLESGKIAIWTVIELMIGIFAGSAPALRPLLRYVPFISNRDSDDGSSGPKGKSGNTGRSLGQSGRNIALETFGGSGKTGPSGRVPKDAILIEDGDSQEFILHGRERGPSTGIQKQVSVRVESESAPSGEDWSKEQRYY